MHNIKKGDIVTRNSYGNDIYFFVKRILKIEENKIIVILKGIDVRIEADAIIDDLKLVSKKEYSKIEKEFILKIEKNAEEQYKNTRSNEFIHTGKILHLDGDSCLDNKNSH